LVPPVRRVRRMVVPPFPPAGVSTALRADRRAMHKRVVAAPAPAARGGVPRRARRGSIDERRPRPSGAGVQHAPLRVALQPGGPLPRLGASRRHVVVTGQESGSARYYATLPILRWDQLDVDFDLALAALRAIGRHPVLLVEDWELPQLARKYPRSPYAQLDW